MYTVCAVGVYSTGPYVH